MVRAFVCAIWFLAAACILQGQANPYAVENSATNIARNLSLDQMRVRADQLSQSTQANDLCLAAELYKRLGDPRASTLYEKAIAASPDEPAYELFYGDYLRLYRGAGQRPLFPAAEQHLLNARGKLLMLLQAGQKSWPACSTRNPIWHQCTMDRVQRSLTALYERDGIQLADRHAENGDMKVERPWLFFSPGGRAGWATDDFDQTSDIRDLTSAFLFANNCLQAPDLRRLCGKITATQMAGMVRVQTPGEARSNLRIRFGAMPVLDITGLARKTFNGTINSTCPVPPQPGVECGFNNPDVFSTLSLVDYGAGIEKPFAVGSITDADLAFTYKHVNRVGLIENHPDDRERIDQYRGYGALSQYLGPDRLNLEYTFVRQNIDPTPDLMRRDRVIQAGSVEYQIFRSLPHGLRRNTNDGLGRHFETRGIDLVAGVLNDKERYKGPEADLITRWDYFAGISAKGLGPVDITFQPTRYSSRVNIDPTESNAQLRLAGNGLIRLLDEERTPTIPSQHFLGMPVAFVQIVVPFHWDVPLVDTKSFESRSIGGELWVKLFTNTKMGVSTLAYAGYSRDVFPLLNKDLNLGRVGLSIGF